MFPSVLNFIWASEIGKEAEIKNLWIGFMPQNIVFLIVVIEELQSQAEL